LNSSNPFDYPKIDFNILDDDTDVLILREAIRSARRLFSAPVWGNQVFGTVFPPSNATTDQELDDYIRSAASPFLHTVGTAAMSAPEANWGVVNPDFRVKGTAGLRIVDASVLVSE
jgi:choline dehydrogenase-like flavoprotein